MREMIPLLFLAADRHIWAVPVWCQVLELNQRRTVPGMNARFLTLPGYKNGAEKLPIPPLSNRALSSGLFPGCLCRVPESNWQGTAAGMNVARPPSLFLQGEFKTIFRSSLASLSAVSSVSDQSPHIIGRSTSFPYPSSHASTLASSIRIAAIVCT